MIVNLASQYHEKKPSKCEVSGDVGDNIDDLLTIVQVSDKDFHSQLCFTFFVAVGEKEKEQEALVQFVSEGDLLSAVQAPGGGGSDV